MIHYQLQCDAAHGFDGWFKDSASFDQQAERGLLQCPECGGLKVTRALMAPAVPRKGNRKRAAAPAADPAPAQSTPAQPAPANGAAPVAMGGPHLPDQIRAALQRVRAEVEKNCDYVGEQFADEARRIHRGDSPQRGIYGEATPDQAEALADEGIDVARVPWLPRSDA